VGLHCVHLPASTAYDYIEHTHEMSRVNGATDVLSIGPSVGYTLFFVFVHVLLLFTSYVSDDTRMHIHVITYIIMVLWIKLKLIMPNSLTVSLACMRRSQYAAIYEMAQSTCRRACDFHTRPLNLEYMAEVSRRPDLLQKKTRSVRRVSPWCFILCWAQRRCCPTD
jgi:hypothetical protein